MWSPWPRPNLFTIDHHCPLSDKIMKRKKYTYIYTHWGRVTDICISKLGYHWLEQWLITWSAPSHYLNHCWNIVNWTIRNKFQWNFNLNSNIFIQENAFEYFTCKFGSHSVCLNGLNDSERSSCWHFCHHCTTVTYYGLVTWYDDMWVNIGSGNGLLPNGIKPLPGAMLTYHQ